MSANGTLIFMCTGAGSGLPRKFRHESKCFVYKPLSVVCNWFVQATQVHLTHKTAYIFHWLDIQFSLWHLERSCHTAQVSKVLSDFPLNALTKVDSCIMRRSADYGKKQALWHIYCPTFGKRLDRDTLELHSKFHKRNTYINVHMQRWITYLEIINIKPFLAEPSL